MDAVVRFAGHGPAMGGGVPGVTTNGHTVESMRFDAAGLANYSLAATAITRSLFRYSDFSGARIAGLMLGYVRSVASSPGLHRVGPTPWCADRAQCCTGLD